MADYTVEVSIPTVGPATGTVAWENILQKPVLSGPGAPTEAASNGTVFIRTDGGPSTTFYVRASGAWSPLASYEAIGEGPGGGGGNSAILSGAGAPTESATNGTLYVRTDGGPSTTLYVRAGGAWAPLASY
jgi:hypothetical protein